MATKLRISTKKIQIDKANTTIVAAVGIAAFLLIFSLVASRALLARRSYQARVITAQTQARDRLKDNIASVQDLKEKYKEFVGRQENIIKGDSKGNGDRDGDNARIILDALPSKYDFPALASSLEKIVKDKNYKILAMSGTDNEATINGATMAPVDGAAAPADGSAAPSDSSAAAGDTSGAETTTSVPQEGGSTAVDMAFEMTVKAPFSGLIDVLTAFRYSIRPIQVQTLVFKADDAGGGDVELTIQGKSFYMPERTLNIKEEPVK